MFEGPDQPSRALIDKCVHCGFCLPTCPTYVLWGEEMDSPRGRIYLMKAGLEGRAEMTESFVQHFDRCLGCLACVTACPSGVQYAPLIEKSRVQIERRYERPEGDRLFRRLLMALIPYPSRLRVLMAPLLVLSPFMGRSGGLSPALTKIFPARLRALLSVAPRVSLSGLVGRTPSRTAAVGTERMKVALLEGCVQRIAFANVNEATVRVLAAEGCRVDAPRAQGCCGALPLHAGHIDQARELARHNIGVFEAAGVDRIVTNAAGCGSAMKGSCSKGIRSGSRGRGRSAKRCATSRKSSSNLGNRGQSGIRSGLVWSITTPAILRMDRAYAASPERCFRPFPVSNSSRPLNLRFAVGARASTISCNQTRRARWGRAKRVTLRRSRRI